MCNTLAINHFMSFFSDNPKDYLVIEEEATRIQNFVCPETGFQESAECQRCEKVRHYTDFNDDGLCSRCVEIIKEHY